MDEEELTPARQLMDGEEALYPGEFAHVVTRRDELPDAILHPQPGQKMVIGLDGEGTYYGREGTLCVLQLALDIGVYILDITKGGTDLVLACKKVLESEDVTKVLHDCKRDSEVLCALYGIRLCNVFDTQVNTPPIALQSLSDIERD